MIYIDKINFNLNQNQSYKILFNSCVKTFVLLNGGFYGGRGEVSENLRFFRENLCFLRENLCFFSGRILAFLGKIFYFFKLKMVGTVGF